MSTVQFLLSLWFLIIPSVIAVKNRTNISPTEPNILSPFVPDGDHLHPFYFIGSVLTILSSLVVITSYIFTPKLRYHPSVTIFYRSVINFGIGLSGGFMYFIDPKHLIQHKSICTNIGHFSTFLCLCSMGCLVILLNDLHIAINNPFSSPYSRSIWKTNIFIIIISFIITFPLRLTWQWVYRSDVQSCGIKIYSNDHYDINPYNLFIYIPLLLAILFTISTTINAYKRLRKGLPNTFSIRRKTIRNAWFYCIIYASYVGIVILFYFMLWLNHNDAQNIWYKLFSLSTSAQGLLDLVVFTVVNWRKLIQNNDDQNIKNIKKINFLQPTPPQFIQQDDVDTNSVCKRFCERFCDRIGISVINDKNNETINEALMLEVLAYTTEGIAQSVDKAIGHMSDISFPQNMKDFKENVINKFNVEIKNNWAVLSQHKDSIQLNGCSISDSDFHHDRNIYHSMSSDESKYLEQREFIDYAPLIFKYIRNDIMNINDNEYKLSIFPSDKMEQLRILKECKCGDGKSGAFFYITHDSKFVVKTIPKHEIIKFISMLPDYLNYLKNNRQTILCKCVGLHSIKIYGLTKYFMVMENVFIGKLKPMEIYDLKGSWVNRQTKCDLHSGSTMKDLDLKRYIVLNDKKRDNVIHQLNIDSEFLAQHNVMDYSLLLGICYMKIECKDDDESENKYDDDYCGAVRAGIVEGPGIYFFGIIDSLQEYTFLKKMENFLKVYIKRENAKGISCVDPLRYKNRFINYMENIMISQANYKKLLNEQSSENIIISMNQ